jgi:transposase
MSSIVLFSDQFNYYLHSGPTSMRKSFDGLCAIIRDELGKQINAKDVFIFLNKERTHVKILLYEPDGFSLFYRRLHKGRFARPAHSAAMGSTQLSAMDLLSMLWGLHLHRIRKEVQVIPS